MEQKNPKSKRTLHAKEEETKPPKANKGGRPSVSPEQRIEKAKTINTSPDELKRINDIYRIKTAGTKTSFSRFAKEVLFALEQTGNGSSKRQATSDQLGIITLELGQIKRELRAIGSNYNQVVKRINSLFVSTDIKREAGQHNALINQIEPLLQAVNQLIERIEKER